MQSLSYYMCRHLFDLHSLLRHEDNGWIGHGQDSFTTLGVRVDHHFSFLCCPIMRHNVLSSVFWCSLRCPHKNDILYLQLFVGGRMSYLRHLRLFAYSDVQHILCCGFDLFFFVLCTLCCQFLWIVIFWLPLRYSLTFSYNLSIN